MKIYIGADHRGYNLKEVLKDFLSQNNREVLDLGNDHYDENDDYPDFSARVAKKVAEKAAELRGTDAELRGKEEARGIVICRSGVGADVVTNKFKGVRSALCFSSEQAYLSRKDDDSNVLALPAGFITDEEAKNITEIWLKTEFSGDEKDRRRLEKLKNIENKSRE